MVLLNVLFPAGPPGVEPGDQVSWALAPGDVAQSPYLVMAPGGRPASGVVREVRLAAENTRLDLGNRAILRLGQSANGLRLDLVSGRRPPNSPG